jgi:lincosamide nucleotidyltransferase A/C/D/E
MMTASDVLEVLGRLEAAGLAVWVDGGWGVDALVGETTREHADLDLVVLAPELGAVRSLLGELGYRTVLRDWLPLRSPWPTAGAARSTFTRSPPPPTGAVTRRSRVAGAFTTRRRPPG